MEPAFAAIPLIVERGQPMIIVLVFIALLALSAPPRGSVGFRER
jgi:hypothetical protein